jgi:tetrahydromethanopterin S-methyltransferase subunit B
MADSNGEMYQHIGRLSEAVRLLQGSVEGMKADLEAMQTTLSEARGGWRTLMWLGGAAGALGVAVGLKIDALLAILRSIPK